MGDLLRLYKKLKLSNSDVDIWSITAFDYV